ncbi:Hypothetical protein PHPALM_10254 [Phytophthora palmivora]|uniref:Uncharacterized protein n=1 Tax=Phytophthora palmivora TaxID=4796 RepID=A0A2P4Y581_9STRA|nr:Hypothetical protein PHPALM_10254 [Phytophthora palmivora]
MEADKTIDAEELYDHGYEGFLEEKNYNMVVYLSMAMKVMQYIIISVQDMYMECLCKTCSHHKNQDELEEKHIRKTSVALPPKQFHRRVPDVLCVVDNELYNQPWST